MGSTRALPTHPSRPRRECVLLGEGTSPSATNAEAVAAGRPPAIQGRCRRSTWWQGNRSTSVSMWIGLWWRCHQWGKGCVHARRCGLQLEQHCGEAIQSRDVFLDSSEQCHGARDGLWMGRRTGATTVSVHHLLEGCCARAGVAPRPPARRGGSRWGVVVSRCNTTTTPCLKNE